MIRTMKDSKELIAYGLADCFKDEPHKIVYWLLTPNPHFGGVSPTDLITIRGDDGLRKVANFVENAQDGNWP